MTRINLIELKTAISANLPNRLIVLFSILFTAIYIKVAGINTAATVSSLATFDADPPFKFRFILPLLLRGIFSLQQLDAKNFHFLFAVPLVMAIFMQQEKFVKKNSSSFLFCPRAPGGHLLGAVSGTTCPLLPPPVS